MAEVSEAIGRAIYPKMAGIKDVPEVIADLERIGFPNCTRATDGTHVPIVCPPQRVCEYINHTGYYSIVRQTLVDHRGCTEEVHNTRIFCRSGVYIHGQARSLFHQMTLS